MLAGIVVSIVQGRNMVMGCHLLPLLCLQIKYLHYRLNIFLKHNLFKQLYDKICRHLYKHFV